MADNYSFIADNPQGNPINQMNGMVNLAQGIQGVQSNAINLQKANQLNQDRVALQQFTSDPNNWQTDGKIDMAKINAVVPKIAPLAGPDYVARMTTLGQAQTQATEAKQNLTQEQRAIIAGPIGVLGRAGVQDPQAYSDAIDQVVKQNPDNPDLVKLADAYKTTLGMSQPGPHVAATAVTASQSLLAPSAQQAALSPTAQLANTGGTQQPVIVNPSVAGYAPSISVPNGQPNAPIKNTLPPTTEVATPEGGKTYLGAGGGKGAGTVAAALPPQEVSKNLSRQDVINNDWKTTVSEAQDAPMKMGVLQNIKSHIPNAVMGQAADQRQVVAGYAQLLGMKQGDIEKMNTDLLAKNAAMLAANGGNTDASRAIAGVMNPNVHMSPEAAMRAADQIGAQIQIKSLKQQYLQPFMAESGDHPEMYEKALANWNKYADPRTLQWSSLSPEEKIQMKSGMNAAQQKKFGEQLQWMEDRGLAK